MNEYEEESINIMKEMLDISKSMFKVARESNVRLLELLQKLN